MGYTCTELSDFDEKVLALNITQESKLRAMKKERISKYTYGQ